MKFVCFHDNIHDILWILAKSFKSKKIDAHTKMKLKIPQVTLVMLAHFVQSLNAILEVLGSKPTGGNFFSYHSLSRKLTMQTLRTNCEQELIYEMRVRC